MIIYIRTMSEEADRLGIEEPELGPFEFKEEKFDGFYMGNQEEDIIFVVSGTAYPTPYSRATIQKFRDLINKP